MFGLGPSELVIVGIVAILLFGKRLPEVAKSLGGSYRQFREGLSEFHSQMDITSLGATPSTSHRSQASSAPRDYDDYEEATAPKFDPPPAEPTPVHSPAESTSSAPSHAPPTT